MRNASMIIFTTLWAFSCSFDIVKQQSTAMIIPNLYTPFTPFKIKENFNTDPEESNYVVYVECSEAVKNTFLFSSIPNFCSGINLKGTAADLNKSLTDMKIFAKSLSTKYLKEARIYYLIWRENQSNKVLKFSQNFEFESQLIVEQLKNVITFNSTSTKNFNAPIAIIDNRFINSRKDAIFTVAVEDSILPNFLHFKILDGKLFVYGDLPEAFNDDLSMKIIIFDKTSNLQSQALVYKFTNTSIENIDTIFAAFVFVFLFISIGMVTTAIICVIRSASLTDITKLEKSQKNSIDKDLSIAKNVLSHSITNWENETQYKKLNALPSNFNFSDQNKSTLNDSINELEILRMDLKDDTLDKNKQNDRSFSVEENIFPVCEFNNISRIVAVQSDCRLSDSASSKIQF